MISRFEGSSEIHIDVTTKLKSKGVAKDYVMSMGEPLIAQAKCQDEMNMLIIFGSKLNNFGIELAL